MGTKDALNYITNVLYGNLDKSKPIIITFLDLAKAFDTVDHQILLDKLYCIGIRGQALDLLSNYLNNRFQSVIIDGTHSENMLINTGVPQGTILGPLLFILYIDDMLKAIPKHEILSYADDTAVITTGESWNEAEAKMNSSLCVINKWLILNRLSLNIDKTVYMTFGNYCNSVPDQLNIKINDQNINRVEYCKYLGIVFDYNMRWNKHT